ncbi:MAG: phosphate/phosphite/phosphonate ABC transporter substrate-binding protein [Chloroflexi bacterium]|nr:phosphate/phosphite/phosphonate ABC transporter substrate-binding protein [Chloroflexota bacterium]
MNKVLLLTIVLAVFVIVGCAAPAPTATPVPPPPTAPPAQPTAAAPQPTATIPPPKCDKLDGMPEVKAGELGSPDKPIVITLVPSGDVPTITKAGNAVADCLGKLTGLSFKTEVGTSYAASIEAMGAGKAQAGFLNTFSAILAQEKYGAVPVLVALRTYKGKLENYYQGQIIANKASGVKTLAELKGKTFCFVDPNSTSGYIIPRIVLKANGIDPDKDLKATQNAGSHDNVAIAVYKGDCDAGATFVDVRTDSNPIKQNYPDILDKVDVISISDNVPNDGLQVIKELDPKLTDAMVKGLLFIGEDAGGKAMLRNLYSYRGLAKIDATFYDAFRKYLESAGVNPSDLVQ